MHYRISSPMALDAATQGCAFVLVRGPEKGPRAISSLNVIADGFPFLSPSVPISLTSLKFLTTFPNTT